MNYLFPVKKGFCFVDLPVILLMAVVFVAIVIVIVIS